MESQTQMTAAELRQLQSPLKDRYREHPEDARTPLHARGDFRDAGLTCTVDTWAGPVRGGPHTATGGDGSDACSGDMLLDALLACAGVTLRSVATAMGVEVRSAELSAEGRTETTPSWTTSTRAEIDTSALVSLMSTSLCSGGWSTPGTLFMGPLRFGARAA